MVIRRSCLAGHSRHFTGWRRYDQAIRFIFIEDSGLMCTIVSPASVLLHRWGQTSRDPRVSLDTCDLANIKRHAEKKSDVSGVTQVIIGTRRVRPLAEICAVVAIVDDRQPCGRNRGLGLPLRRGSGLDRRR
jgi:hypothetical protein